MDSHVAFLSLDELEWQRVLERLHSEISILPIAKGPFSADQLRQAQSRTALELTTARTGLRGSLRARPTKPGQRFASARFRPRFPSKHWQLRAIVMPHFMLQQTEIVEQLRRPSLTGGPNESNPIDSYPAPRSASTIEARLDLPLS